MTATVILTVLRVVGSMIAFLLPGWLLARRVPSLIPGVAAFLGSAVVLFNVILLLSVVGIHLGVIAVGMGLMIVAGLVAWKLPQVTAVPPGSAAGKISGNWIWWIAAAVGFTSIVIHAVVEPLSGFDNSFRWDYLARMLVSRGSLASYPPMTAPDFELYGWCDGIPPLVSFLDFWLYTAVGTTASVVTVIRVATEVLLTGWVVFRFGCAMWGGSAGRVTVAVLACSAVFPWAFAIGQETGLTTLAFVTLLFLLNEHRTRPECTTAFWAAIAAALGALSREYGLTFIAFGFVVLALQRAPRRNLVVYAVTSVLAAAPWYIRNWILTGNPVYPQSLGGVFPTNPVHEEVMRSIAREWSFASSEHDRLYLVQALGATCGVVLLIATVGAWRAGRRTALLAGGSALVVLLWAWSVPETAGGWIYSLRVLAPVLAIGAVLSGWIAGIRGEIRAVFAAVIILAAVDAARRSWYLPVKPMTPVMPWSFAEWSRVRQQVDSVSEKNVYTVLVRAAAGDGIVVDHPLYHSIVVAAGGRAIPLMSPALAPTFKGDAPFADVADQLRAEKIRFIVIDPTSRITRELALDHPFWRELVERHTPQVRTRFLAIYDLAMAVPKTQ